MKTTKSAVGAFVYFVTCFLLGMYFTFAAVQGDGGLFERVRAEADARALSGELARYEAEISALENRTRRLSDAFLDIDLLDQQVRETLGMVRADEVIIP